MTDKTPLNSHLAADALRVRLLVSVLLIAGVILVSQAVLQFHMAQQAGDAALINDAGRQRMRSQRLSKDALWIKLGNPAEKAKAIDEARDTIAKFVSTQKDIQSSAISHDIIQITPFFRHIVQGSERMVTNAPTAPDEVLANEAELLTRMDSIVTKYQFDAEKRMNSQRFLEEGLGLLALLVLAAEWFLILRPAIGLVRKHSATEARLREEAQFIARSKAEFLANMSHEIRTPMNGIMGMNSLIMMTELTETQRGYAKIVDSSAQSLLTVLNDILDLSKLEQATIELESIPFDIRELVEELLTLFKPQAHLKGIEIVGGVDIGVQSKVIGDPTRVRQVLSNLLSNAVKFTSTGQIRLWCTLESSTRPDELRFEVSDTGIGMSPEAQDRIFEVYSQADASTTRRFGGTGLGLSICKRLVERMDGRISVSSRPGEGSSFLVVLPLPADGSISDDSAGARLGGVEVLAVDDNEVNRTILAQHLHSLGAVPKIAASAGDALEMFQREKGISIAILDFDMPGINGLQLAKTMRDLRPEVQLVLLSSVSASSLQQDQLPGLFSAVHLKPMRRSALGDILSSLVHPTAKVMAIPEAHIKKHLKVLVAEDDLISQMLSQRLLETLQHEVVMVSDGEAAVTAFEAGDFDVVFMDWHMPKLDGIAASRMILQHHPDACLIIGLTASTMQEEVKACLDAGMSGVLAKPIRLAELENLLDSLSN